MKGLKKYASFFRVRFLYGLQYRAAALAGIATQFAWGILYVLLFRAFYQANPAGVPMEPAQLNSYLWLQQAFLGLTMIWTWDKDISESITQGNVAYELTRPLDLYTMWFTKCAASRSANAALRCMPILLVAFLLPACVRLNAPASLPAFLLFLLTLLLGFLVCNAFVMLMYLSVFFTMSPMGVRMVLVSLTDFLSGSLIPIPFMPKGLQQFILLTPFGSMQNLPYRIYSGNLSGNQLWLYLGVQIFWLAALWGMGKTLMRTALKKVVVQGG